MSKKISEITTKVVELLESLDAGEQRRILKASAVLLTDSAIENTDLVETFKEESESSALSLNSKAKAWVNKNSITSGDLERVFYFGEDKIEIILNNLPGDDDKQKTINSYLLVGVISFLKNGEAKFKDEEARALCTTMSCLNNTNHAKYVASARGWIVGSKKDGWVLTVPGLNEVANLLRSTQKNDE